MGTAIDPGFHVRAADQRRVVGEQNAAHQGVVVGQQVDREKAELAADEQRQGDRVDVEVFANIDLGRQGAFHSTDLFGQRAHFGLGLQQLVLQLQHEPVGKRIILAAGMLEQVGDADVAGHAHDRMYAFAAHPALPEPRRMVGVQGEGDAAAQGAQVELVVIGHRQLPRRRNDADDGLILGTGRGSTRRWFARIFRRWASLDLMALASNPLSSTP
ncbi:hypothetical protein D3C79_583820 [compost metagenome]